MAVQPQTPYKEYDANGVVKSFNLEFDCENKDHLIVTIDGVEPPSETWSLDPLAKNVTFTNAPDAGKKITLKRNTPYSRTTSYQSYDNSFRPGPVNKDLDRLWWKVQELGVGDWLLLDRMNKLHQDQEEKIQKYRDDVNLTALEYTLEQAQEIKNDTAALAAEVQDNVEQSQTLLTDTTAQANAAAISAADAIAAKEEAEISANTAITQANGLRTYVDTSLSGLSMGANKYYPTLTAANIDIANIAVGQAVWIGDEATGGLYEKSTAGATSLTKSAFDPLGQAKNYTDLELLEVDSVFTDSALSITGKNLDGVATDRYNSSDFIPVIAGQVMLIRTQAFATNEAFLFYTLSKIKIPADPLITYNGVFFKKVIVPKGASFLRVTSATNNHPSYVPYVFSLGIYNNKLDKAANITYKDFLSRATDGTYLSLTAVGYKHLWIRVDEGQVLRYSNLITPAADALRFYDKDLNLMGGGYAAPSGAVKAPASAKFALITCITPTHASYISSLYSDFAIKIGAADEISLDNTAKLTIQLEKKVRVLEAGGLVAYFNSAFTEGGLTSTYSRTKKIETLGLKKIFISAQMAGTGVLIRKHTVTGVVSDLAVGLSSIAGPYMRIYDIPEDAAYIDVQSMNSTHASYQSDFENIVVLANTEEDIIKYLQSYFSAKTYTGFSKIGKHPWTASTTYNSTQKIMFAPNMDFSYSVMSSGGAMLVANLNNNTSEQITPSKQIYKTTSFGWLQLATYNSTHANFNPTFVPSFKFVTGEPEAKSSSDFVAASYLPTICLKTVREATFKDGTDKTAIQYLWHDSEFNFFISDSRSGERKFIFAYSAENFYGYEPHWFSMGFDSYGNIICVFRTEGLAQNYSDDVRKNPIVLLKSKNYEPQVIAVPGLVRPSGWLQNCGFLCTEDAVFFTEYTRPSVQTAHTWKVNLPVTEPSNWKKVQSFTITPDSTAMKHIHNVERDPHTGFIYTSTGDDSNGAGIYVSTDNGETFTQILAGSEKYCRVLNFIWLKDMIYWATDSGGSNHWVFKATRNASGILDVTNITDLHMFPNVSQPTYASIYFPKIKVILFLGRADGVAGSMPIELLDLTNDSFHIIDTIYPINKEPAIFGFRCECFEYIPRGNELICGFSRSLGPGGYLNTIGMLGNTLNTAQKVNNILINVERVGAGFTVNYDTLV